MIQLMLCTQVFAFFFSYFTVPRQFFCSSSSLCVGRFIGGVCFCRCWFLISHSFGASVRLCFVLVFFLGIFAYIIWLMQWYRKSPMFRDIQVWTKRVDQDQMPQQNAASDQGLQGLPFIKQVFRHIKGYWNGLVVLLVLDPVTNRQVWYGVKG